MKKVQIFTDTSGGRKVIGLGAVIVTDGPELSLGMALKPGLTTTEAEIAAMMFGLDIFKLSWKPSFGSKVFIVFNCDSEPVVKSINGIGSLRGLANSMAKNFLEELVALTGKEISGWAIKHIKRTINKADPVARQARSRWIQRFRKRNSGRF